MKAKKTMKVGLLGYPLDHSLSPAIHNAAYQALGLDWHYRLYPCSNQQTFDEVLGGACKEPDAYVGFNVTTPYKAAAYKAASKRSCSAEAAESANVLTVLCQAGSGQPLLSCDNTDGQGLVASLERQAGISVSDSVVILCGTGSVARATLRLLLEKQAAGIVVASRDKQAAQKRVNALLSYSHCPSHAAPPSVIDYGEIAQHLAVADVLIDATTVGMASTDEAVVPVELLRQDMVVVDVVYAHGETALIQGARERGAKAFDGLGMLIEQAALSIEIWAQAQGLKLEAPRELMQKAAHQELANRL